MPITTYAELKDTIGRWLNREDLAEHVADFIALGERRISGDLRIADAETDVTLTTTAGTADIDLPADYLEGRGVTALTPAVATLPYVTPALLVDTHGAAAQGPPADHTIIGRKLRLGPTPDRAYDIRLTYYAKAPALTDAAPTNWLLTLYPDVLLYAALIESAPFLGDDSRLSTWGGLYDSAIGRVQTADGRARWGGGPLTIKISGTA